ncbi:hypothetical protein NG895_24490, partial [Aeoliella sp. ICT_H6.2]
MTPMLRSESFYWTSIRRVLIASVAVTSISTRSEAQLQYDFNTFAGDVLATLELSNLPATINDIEALTFTSEGKELFGLGPTYQGVFDRGSGTIIEIGTDWIAGHRTLAAEDDGVTIFWSDNAPPYASVPPAGLSPRRFSMGFNIGFYTPPLNGVSSLEPDREPKRVWHAICA